MITTHKPVVLLYIENMPIMSYMYLVYEEMTFNSSVWNLSILKYLRFITFINKSLRIKGIFKYSDIRYMKQNK